MQLVIRRSQADVKGMFGGHKGVSFSLYYRLVLTPDEEALVQRYQLGYHTLTRSQVKVDTVADAIKGVTETMDSVEVLIHNEKAIKGACNSFYALLQVARTFGGEEVVSIPAEE